MPRMTHGHATVRRLGPPRPGPRPVRSGPPAAPAWALLAALLASPACEPHHEGRTTEAAPAASAPEGGGGSPESPWRVVADSEQIAVSREAMAGGFAEATAEARKTGATARSRWAAAPAEDRRRWAVKWAAPTLDGGVEYVWVAPLAWSPFRVEGRLASAPVADLRCGRGRDDLVGFPIEELADWVHFLSDDPAGPREGGFTIDWLDAHVGIRADGAPAQRPSSSAR